MTPHTADRLRARIALREAQWRYEDRLKGKTYVRGHYRRSQKQPEPDALAELAFIAGCAVVVLIWMVVG